MLELVDAHCHLAAPGLRERLDEVLERAREAGLRSIVSVGSMTSIETDRLTVEIAEQHPDVYAVVGIHPHDAREATEARIAAVRELAGSKKVVAIGESGLDFHYMHSPRDAQEQSLRAHLELARQSDLPIVIHCREAEARVAAILREAGVPARGGMIHCFSGDQAAAREFLELGLYISYSGAVTFKNAQALRATVPLIPEERLLVETDAPYLAPEPYRGHPNEPAYVAHTLAMVARLRDAEPNRIGALVTKNAARLFRIRA